MSLKRTKLKALVILEEIKHVISLSKICLMEVFIFVKASNKKYSYPQDN